MRKLFHAIAAQPWLRRTSFHLALLVLCGVILYANTLQVPFYLDDLQCIVNNPVVHRFGLLFDLDRFRELGMTEDTRNSVVARVVTYATFALNYRLHGLALPGYHLVNLVIHLANTLLVYGLVRVTLDRCRLESVAPEGRRRSLALAVALLFVAHPLQTSAVTYVVQRFELLGTFFYLAALLAYSGAVLDTAPRRRRLCYGVALLATLLGMFSKETVFTLPLLIALYDGVFLPGERRQRWQRLAPFFVLMIPLPLTIAWLASLSQVTGQDFTHSVELMNYAGVSSLSYLLIQLRVVVFYVRLLLFPAGLNIDHDFPAAATWHEPATLGSGLLLAGLFGLGWYLLLRPRSVTGGESRDWRHVGFGLIWFFVTLSMSSSVIPLDDLVMEYRLYLPAAGFFLAIAGTAAAGHDVLARRWPQLAATVPLATLLVVPALGAATLARNQIWRDEVAFFEDSVRKSPGKARPATNLVNAYGKQGRFDAALAQARVASQARGHTQVTRFALARIYNQLGQDELAIAELRRVLDFAPNNAEYHAILGQLYVNTGNIAAAVAAFDTALALDPADSGNVRATLEAIGHPRAPR